MPPHPAYMPLNAGRYVVCKSLYRPRAQQVKSSVAPTDYAQVLQLLQYYTAH